jgi:hypothetical protein
MPCRVPCTGRRGTPAAGARARRDSPVCRASYVSERSRRGATGPGGDPRISWNWSVDRTAVVALLIGSGAARRSAATRSVGRSASGPRYDILIIALIVPAFDPAVRGRRGTLNVRFLGRPTDGESARPPGDRGAAEPGTSAVSRQPRPAHRTRTVRDVCETARLPDPADASADRSRRVEYGHTVCSGLRDRDRSVSTNAHT